MKAYKFLTADGVGVFSRFVWPLPGDAGPGAWVASDVDACRSGIHACRPIDLPYWLTPALYEIELDGQLEEQAVKVVAPRGRLIRRVDAWGPETIEAYSRMCISRADDLIAAAPELESWRPPSAIALSEPARLGFITARIAEERGGTEAHVAERRHQSEWLVGLLALD